MKGLKKWQRVLVSFIFAVLMTNVVSVFGIYNFKQLNNAEAISNDKKSGQVSITGKYGVLFLTVKNMLASAGNKEKEKVYYEKAASMINNLNAHDADYEAALTSAEEVKIWNDFKDKRAKAQKEIARVIELINSGKVKDASVALDTKTYRAMKDAQTAENNVLEWFI